MLQHSRNRDGVEFVLREMADDGVSRIGFVVFLDLLLGEEAAKRNGAGEVVCVGCSKTGKLPSGLAESRRISAVGVGDPSGRVSRRPEGGERGAPDGRYYRGLVEDSSRSLGLGVVPDHLCLFVHSRHIWWRCLGGCVRLGLFDRAQSWDCESGASSCSAPTKD